MNKPAIEGGKPVREDYIVFGKPEIGKEEIEDVVKVLKSGWLSTGPQVELFENNIKEYLGCKNAIAVNSCTAALHLSLLCSGITKGDEVIVTPMTFGATVNVIEHVGAKPVFVDIKKDSYNIDANKIQQAITSKTKAIIPVHFAGLPCDMDVINKIAKENNLKVIEDAAHAIGAEYKSKKIGNSENLTCFSFYVTKNVCAGDGGIVTLNDDDLAATIGNYALHGLSKHAWQRYSKEGIKTYQVIYPGYKYKMGDINAAIANNQLKKLDRFNSIREKYAKIYFNAFKSNDLIELPATKPNRKSSWHLFPILLNLDKLNISRLKFMEALKHEGVGSGIHYTSMHLQPYYKEKYGYKEGMFERAEYVGERTVSIPLQTSISEDDINDIINAVEKILNYYKK